MGVDSRKTPFAETCRALGLFMASAATLGRGSKNLGHSIAAATFTTYCLTIK